MRLCVTAAVAVGLLAPALARADHDHGQHAAHTDDQRVAAKLSLALARYQTASFLGDYQGFTPALRWSRGRFTAGANASLYRLTTNGARHVGLGDIVIDGQTKLVGDHAASAGVALAVSLPTGSRRDHLGMGHVMLMPSVWGAWMNDDIALVGSIGYGRAVGGDAHAHHGGSTGPIVDPMNLVEVTWSAGGDLALADVLRAGVRFAGAVAIGEGVNRVVGGVRVAWTEGDVATTAELQGGLAGDPFEVRGVLATELRF